LKRVLSIGVNPDVPGADGNRPCHLACELGLLSIYKAIVLCRPDMDAENKDGVGHYGCALAGVADLKVCFLDRSTSRLVVIGWLSLAHHVTYDFAFFVCLHRSSGKELATLSRSRQS
jgi:hypothetical protein